MTCRQHWHGPLQQAMTHYRQTARHLVSHQGAEGLHRMLVLLVHVMLKFGSITYIMVEKERHGQHHHYHHCHGITANSITCIAMITIMTTTIITIITFITIITLITSITSIAGITRISTVTIFPPSSLPSPSPSPSSPSSAL